MLGNPYERGSALERLEDLAARWEKMEYNGACIDKAHCLQISTDIRVLLDLILDPEE